MFFLTKSMARFTNVITIGFVLIFCTLSHLDGISLDRLFLSKNHQRTKRATDEEIRQRIPVSGVLVFNHTLVAGANIPRKFACLFVFDKEASEDLNNNFNLANKYASQLATFASLYTAHANIIITNAGVEMWSDSDRISFAIEKHPYSPVQDFLPRFQTYLAATKKALFGTIYTVGVLISNKGSWLINGGYSQGPANTTSGTSIINYRDYPWRIAGLLAHELAHTLSVVHPFELEYLCQDCPQLPFCPSVTSKPIIDECRCNSTDYPPEQCLMTFQFGRAQPAPRYTTCDMQMMNFFSADTPCHRR